MKTKELASELQEYTVAMRREFHMHPEPSYQEKETSLKIQAELKAANIPFEVVGDYNVVATLRFGEGKKLAIRADIDALPIQEELDVPWKSKNDGVMHACGHDTHTAMLLSTAKGLLKMSDSLTGTIYLCFQQAEESGGCADECVTYLEAQGGVDGAVSIHVMPSILPGEMDVTAGVRCSGSEIFYLDIEGQGGHGSRLDMTIDPIEIACEIYQRLKLIPIYHHNPFRTSIVSVCMLTAGSRANIVGDTAHMEGTVRYFSLGDGDIILEKINTVAQQVASAHGGKVTMRSSVAAKYPVINDAKSVAIAQAAAKKVGLTPVEVEPNAGSDNFAEFLHAFGGCYCNLGTKSSRPGTSDNLHNVTVDIDEDALEYGVAFFLQYSEDFMKQD